MDVMIEKREVHVTLTVNLSELSELLHLMVAGLSVVPDGGGTEQQQALVAELRRAEMEAYR